MEMKSYRKRNRLREIEFSKLEEMKEKLNITYKDIALLLGIGSKQIQMYRKCGRVPADRYYAMRDALLIDIEQQATRDRARVMEVMGLSVEV